MRFSWLNNTFLGDEPNAYVIKFDYRVDNFYDGELSYFDGDAGIKNKKYVLILPNKIKDYTGLYVDFEDGTHGLVDDLMTGSLFQVKFYNPQKTNISVILTDMPRHWLYTKIATLHKKSQLPSFLSQIFGIDKTQKDIYVINSPRSNQVVAGRQIL
ncbi:MAG: hypothetical protein GXP45_04750 [bacterium]|nr:hypothetical protein [bacterium]